MNIHEFYELVCTVQSVSASIVELSELDFAIVVESQFGQCRVELFNGLCQLEYSGRIGTGTCHYNSFDDESLIQAIRDCL